MLAPEEGIGESAAEVRLRVGLKFAWTSGKILSLLRLNRFLRRAQRRQGRLQIGIVAQRALDQGVERRRFEQHPPFLRNVAAFDEPLRPAGRRIGGGGLSGERLARIAGDLGRGGMQEVRPDRAACQEGRCRECGGTCRKPPDRYVQHLEWGLWQRTHEVETPDPALFPI